MNYLRGPPARNYPIPCVPCGLTAAYIARVKHGGFRVTPQPAVIRRCGRGSQPHATLSSGSVTQEIIALMIESSGRKISIICYRYGQVSGLDLICFSVLAFDCSLHARYNSSVSVDVKVWGQSYYSVISFRRLKFTKSRHFPGTPQMSCTTQQLPPM